MSEYASMQGWYWFSSRQEYETTVEEYSSIVSEFNSVDTDTGVVLEIPFDLYRNLHRHTEELGDRAEEYLVVSATMDGHLFGWVATETGEVEIDLIEWSDEHPDFDISPKNFIETNIQQELINAFIEEHYTGWDENYLTTK